MQYDWCPSMERRLGQRHTQKKDPERTQGEGGCLQGKVIDILLRMVMTQTLGIFQKKKSVL